MNKIIKLQSGLRLALHTIKSTRSVAIGIYVNTGSAFETPELAGISHFIEHMLFKGTKNRTAFQIAEEMELAGAQINAFTSREITSYYTMSTDEHTEKCMEMLSDIFFHATLTEENIEKEKGVVIEEINMCEDDPADLCLDNLSKAYYGDGGLGSSILGTAETVKSFTPEMIRRYMDEHYTAGNVVIAAAGNIDFNMIKELAIRYFEANFITKGSKKTYLTGDVQSRLIPRFKPIEQANLAFAFPSYNYDNDKSLAAALLSNVLGGGMSSRLFQKLREEMALVYDIYATESEYKPDGLFIIYLGTNPASVCKAVTAVRDVILTMISEGITEREFKKGKEQLKSAVVLGAERAISIMRAAGSRAILTNKTFDLDERLDAINNITLDDIKEVVSFIFDFNKVSASYVGKEPDCDILKLIKGE